MTRRKPHPFGILHRYGGITSAVVVIIICMTGLLLNHTEDLKLDERSVANPWLLNWYGIEVPPALSVSDTQHTATQLGNRIWIDAQPAAESRYRLTGLVTLPDALVLTTEQELFLFTPDAQLIERIDSGFGLPTPVLAAGLAPDNRIALRDDTVLRTGTTDLTDWTATQDTNIRWSESISTPPGLLAELQQQYRGDGLSLERVILDLHSGRLLGRAGLWIADAAALLFILLALTGIWMWFKTRRRNA